MKLIFGLLFAITLLFAGPPSAAYAEGIDIEAAAIQAVVPDVVAKFGVSEENAREYLRTVTAAIRARKAADANKDDLSALYADVLDKIALAQVYGASVLEKGQRLFDTKIKDAVPGTPVPLELVQEINLWASSAGMVLKIGSEADRLVAEYAAQSFLKDTACQVGANTFNIDGCLKRLEKSVNMLTSAVDHMSSTVDAISVLQLAVVSRMTF